MNGRSEAVRKENNKKLAFTCSEITRTLVEQLKGSVRHLVSSHKMLSEGWG